MKIVIPYDVGIPEGYNQRLRDLGAEVYEGPRPDRSEFIRRLKKAEIFVANISDRVSEVIDEAKDLKYLILLAAGYETINLSRLREAGITVVTCPIYSAQAVAEQAIALFFAVARKIVLANQSLKAGEWRVEDFEGTEIAGKKVGLIGHGNVGKKIEKLVAGLGAGAVHVNSKSASEDIDSLISGSDIVIVCAALTPATKHLIDARRLGLFKRGAILINVSRGSIIDQLALYEVLKTGKISAGLDVYENEPSGGKMATDPPNQAIMKLAKLPNVVATPHIAFNTKEALDRLGEEIIVNIQACLKGQPINVAGEHV